MTRPERIIEGIDGRSRVEVYADSVLKSYFYRAELHQRREAEALRRWESTGIVPRLLASGDGWLRMSRLPGDTGSDRADPGEIGLLLARLHRAVPAPEATLPTQQCRTVFAHGDFALHNIMVDNHVTGVIDLEKSQPMCFAVDLASYLVHVLLGKAPGWREFLDGYGNGIDVEHLAAHVELFRQWAQRAKDASFARQVDQVVNEWRGVSG